MKLRGIVQLLLIIASPAMVRADVADLMAEARSGDAEAQYLLACAWIRGDIDGSRDMSEAIACLRQSSEQDHASAQGLLGFVLLETALTDEELREAVACMRKGADGGCPWG